MRTVAVAFLLAAAAPAAAQSTLADVENLRAQQEAAARRAVALSNELGALESRLRTEQAITDLRIQREGVRVPELPYTDVTTPSSTSAAVPRNLPSIPDAALADSNRRVRDASQPRR
ncbi:hypothetical protein [uncultured Phenylobacterium sp.]|uniref:hypothetical protein n=1 Tax=uncultured Phenylobacterium sp. TaxID=349273 RepID=UPI0025D6D002|nr:hypothetical protein [uncultured Phenylobacterium sp.]